MSDTSDMFICPCIILIILIMFICPCIILISYGVSLVQALIQSLIFHTCQNSEGDHPFWNFNSSVQLTFFFGYVNNIPFVYPKYQQFINQYGEQECETRMRNKK
jgi:hypothetical protein